MRLSLSELIGITLSELFERTGKKAIIEARLDEYERNPEVGSSWEEAKARILAGLRTE